MLSFVTTALTATSFTTVLSTVSGLQTILSLSVGHWSGAALGLASLFSPVPINAYHLHGIPIAVLQGSIRIVSTLFLVVRILSPFYAPNWTNFPDSPIPKSLNIVYIGKDGEKFRSKDLPAPFVLEASTSEVQAAVMSWIRSRPLIHLVNKGSNWIYVTQMTPLWGFVDDVALRWSPGQKEGTTVLELRSQSRIGRKDVNKNYQRLKDLVNFLSTKLKK